MTNKKAVFGFLNKTIKIVVMRNEDDEDVVDAKLVQQKLFVKTEYPLAKHDILRKKVVKCQRKSAFYSYMAKEDMIQA